MRLIFKLGTVHPLCINERLTYIQWPTLLCLTQSEIHSVLFLCFYSHFALCVCAIVVYYVMQCV